MEYEEGVAIRFLLKEKMDGIRRRLQAQFTDDISSIQSLRR
jgi:hypothetical protein